MDKLLFDRSLPFSIVIRRAGAEIPGVFRYPTDDEFAKRERAMKVYYRRGNSLPEIENQEQADLDLATAIHTDGAPPDENTAGRIVGFLIKAEVADAPERTAEGFEVRMKVANGAETVHVLREPTEREIRRYRERAIWMSNPKFGRQEARTLLSAVSDFYEKLLVRVDGYPGAKETVPINHRNTAVQAVLTCIAEEREADEVEPENFSKGTGPNSPARVS